MMAAHAVEGRRRWISKEWLLLLATVVVIAITAVIDSQHTYKENPTDSAIDIARQVSLLGISTLGVAVVIIVGGIDLSIGSVIALSGAVCAAIMVVLAPDIMAGTAPLDAQGQPPLLPLGVIAAAIGGALASGLAVGTLHAWLITRIGLPPFITTLATLVGLRSLARLLIEHVTLAQYGSRATQIYFTDPNFLALKQVAIPFATFLVLAVLVWLLLSRTVLGRHLYAIGGNEQAARLSGIRIDLVKWVAYSLSAVLASIAGVFLAAQISTSEPQNAGQTEELNAIAAAVVGGASLQGGVGTVPGAALGVLFMRCVLDGIAKVIKSGSEIYQGLVVGIVVALAVAFSQTNRAGGREPLFPGWLGTAAIMVIALLGGTLALVMVGPKAAQGTSGCLLLGCLLLKWRQARARG